MCSVMTPPSSGPIASAIAETPAEVPIPRSLLIAGRATLTTVLSSMIMNRANESAPSVHHLRFSSAKIAALIGSGQVTEHYASREMEIVWTPRPEVLEQANVVRLMGRLGVDNYRELQRRSAQDPDWFWPAAIEDMGLEFSQQWDRVVDLSRGPEWATWFVGGKLNLAWNCVHRWAERTPEVAAANWESEDGERHGLTYRELSDRVTRFAEALVSLGVRPGDRVAFFLPMSPEVSIVSHACAHIGAVQVPVFSGFAAPAVAQRLQDSEAKVVVTADGSLRRGREVPMKEIVDEAVRESPSVEHVVVWRRLGREDVPMTPRRDLFDAEAMSGRPGALEPLEVDSEHPYLLTYTSGTTGRPKGVLHVQGGFLVSITREVAYQADARPEDVIHFVTDMGWIMGPWTVVGGGAMGCTVLFAEGAPDWPADRLWSLTERERISILGCSPTLIRALIPHGLPAAHLEALR